MEILRELDHYTFTQFRIVEKELHKRDMSTGLLNTSVEILQEEIKLLHNEMDYMKKTIVVLQESLSFLIEEKEWKGGGK